MDDTLLRAFQLALEKIDLLELNIKDINDARMIDVNYMDKLEDEIAQAKNQLTDYIEVVGNKSFTAKVFNTAMKEAGIRPNEKVRASKIRKALANSFQHFQDEDEDEIGIYFNSI